MNRSRVTPPALMRLALLCVLLVSGSGCQWLQKVFGPHEPPPALPRILPERDPTLGQVIDAVNNNSGRIHSLSTDQAQISGDQLIVPLSKTRIDFERPRRLRVRAGTPFFGTELDLGNNDEMLWFWVRQDPSPAVYFVRHDQFYHCPARRNLPIDPNWLIEALGVVEFHENEQHEGPFLTQSGQLQIRTTRRTPDGEMTKLTTVDPRSAAVVSQTLWDAQNRFVAGAYTQRHRRDALTGVILPETVTLELPDPNLPDPRCGMVRLELYLGRMEVNTPRTSPMETFLVPNYPNAPPVDLCNPQQRLGPPVGSPGPIGSPPAASIPRRYAGPQINRLLR